MVVVVVGAVVGGLDHGPAAAAVRHQAGDEAAVSGSLDVVFDSVGGRNMLKSFEATALNGHVASTVSMCDLDLTTAHFKGLSLHVVFMLIPMLHDVG